MAATRILAAISLALVACLGRGGDAEPFEVTTTVPRATPVVAASTPTPAPPAPAAQPRAAIAPRGSLTGRWHSDCGRCTSVTLELVQQGKALRGEVGYFDDTKHRATGSCEGTRAGNRVTFTLRVEEPGARFQHMDGLVFEGKLVAGSLRGLFTAPGHSTPMAFVRAAPE